ncbi:MAG: sigma-70 family RNA polymerase sigma factor [Acidimicrobiia bacterium]
MTITAHCHPAFGRVRLERIGGLAMEERIRAFVDTEYGKVVSAVRAATGRSDGAEDAVQEALVKVLRDGHHPDNLAAWVTVVATNEVRRVQRRQLTERRVSPRTSQPADGGLEGVAVATDVRKAIADLPDRQREIVMLFCYLDASVADIAASMGISGGTVKTQLHRARATLGEALGLEARP